MLQGTLLGLFSFLLVIEVIYLAMSWDYAMYMMSPNVHYPREKGKLAFIVIFFGRAALIVLTSFFLALVRSQPVSKEEQVFTCRDALDYPGPAHTYVYL